MANEIAVASVAFEVYLIISAGVGALAQYLHGGEPVPPRGRSGPASFVAAGSVRAVTS